MNTITYGFYDLEKRQQRVAKIRSTAKEYQLGKPNINEPYFLNALAELLKKREERKEAPIALVGSLSDVHQDKPKEVSKDIWLNGIILLLEDEKVPIYPIDMQMRDVLELNIQSSVVREYHEVFKHLRTELDRRMDRKLRAQGVKYGRPPYGFKTVKGHMVQDETKSSAVMYIFKRLREKIPPSQLLEELKLRFPVEKRGKKTKKQFWDYVKIKRIVSKAPLYCQGKYVTSDGEVVILEDLAFLPKEWADTKWPLKHTKE